MNYIYSGWRLISKFLVPSNYTEEWNLFNIRWNKYNSTIINAAINVAFSRENVNFNDDYTLEDRQIFHRTKSTKVFFFVNIYSSISYCIPLFIHTLSNAAELQNAILTACMCISLSLFLSHKKNWIISVIIFCPRTHSFSLCVIIIAPDSNSNGFTLHLF